MAQQLHIVGIGGTLRENSRSRFALEHALKASEAESAITTLINLNETRLPFYEPGRGLESYGEFEQNFIDTARRADGMIWSTGAYHGTLAGVTKNALDWLEFLSGEDSPYLLNKPIGLIATAGGDMAGVTALQAMVHTVHALRGNVVPLMVSIPNARHHFDSEGNLTTEKWSNRLNQLGKLVVETTRRYQAEVVAS